MMGMSTRMRYDEIRDIDPAEDTLKQCPGENISDSTVVVSDSVMI